MATAAITVEATQDRAGLDTAYRLLWLAVLFDILASASDSDGIAPGT